jgi:hypothetical protein
LSPDLSLTTVLGSMCRLTSTAGFTNILLIRAKVAHFALLSHKYAEFFVISVAQDSIEGEVYENFALTANLILSPG